MSLTAIQHVRRMRGGTQPHLMRCDDGGFYVVKFQDNPQHTRILANEYLSTRLAQIIGLPVPEAAIVEVEDWLINHTPDLHFKLGHRTVRCSAGLHFGSAYAVNPLNGQVFDYFPAELIVARVRNLVDFAGILAFDKWTGNADGRQVVFWRLSREQKYTASFIDHGYCFNGGEWTFRDYPTRGVYPRNEVFAGVTGWISFEPWLSRIDGISLAAMNEIVSTIPPDWYGSDKCALLSLVKALHSRRKCVRECIDTFRLSPQRPFPHWQQSEETRRARMCCGF